MANATDSKSQFAVTSAASSKFTVTSAVKSDSENPLVAALRDANIQVHKFNRGTQRVSTSIGNPSLINFAKTLRESLGSKIVNHPGVVKATFDITSLGEMLEKFVGSTRKADIQALPAKYQGLTLNVVENAAGKELQFVMTTKDEFISSVGSTVWLRSCKITEADAIEMARKVELRYLPRHAPGIVPNINKAREEVHVLNSYIPAEWMTYAGEVPDELPPLFKRLIDHLFQLEVEREYFYSWLWHSLFDRAFVYLILCGAGGIGKNRLKLVMRALHGFENTMDGKKSTLNERFNSQIADNTLGWFDELHYNAEMENVMKELQNDSISIEKKSVDATRSTRIYASFVISNNKPRDNYIAFDARKFAPLQLTHQRLDAVMTNEEIQELTDKTENWDSPTYDVAFIAQIGRWVRKHGKSDKWPTLEYKGPMFYKLAHTSMSLWQKLAASTVLTLEPGKVISKLVHDSKKGFLWSTVEDQYNRKNGRDRKSQFPEYSTVQHFFDMFVGADAKKAFKTEAVPGSLVNDFYVKVINRKVEILNEAAVTKAVAGVDHEYLIPAEDLL